MAYTTRKTLLQGVHNNDTKSWEEFQEFYSPLIYLVGRDCNLTMEEIQDLRQEVLLEVFHQDLANNYDPQRGRFRDYLRQVIRRKAYLIFKKRERPIVDISIWENKVDTSMQEHWEKDWEDFLMQVAIQELKERVQESTYLTFELYDRKKLPPEEVAQILHITTNQVYVNHTRVMKMLKEIVEALKQVE